MEIPALPFPTSSGLVQPLFRPVWLSFGSRFNVFHGVNQPSFRIGFRNDVHQCPLHKHICARPLLGIFGNQCTALLSFCINNLSRTPCHPHAQSIQHTTTATPCRALFRQEKFKYTMRDTSPTSIRLELPPSALGRALFTGEQHPSPLRNFVGCSRGFSAQPHEWNHLYFCLCGVYNICNKLTSYDIYAPA